MEASYGYLDDDNDEYNQQEDDMITDINENETVIDDDDDMAKDIEDEFSGSLLSMSICTPGISSASSLLLLDESKITDSDLSKPYLSSSFFSSKEFELLLQQQQTVLKHVETTIRTVHQDPKIHCSICEEDVVETSMITFPCGHKYCSMCCKRYIESNAYALANGITCPFSGCKEIISSGMLSKIGASEIASLVKSMQFQALGREKKKCSHCNESLVVPLRMVEAHCYDALQCKKADCPKNKYLICFYCEDVMSERSYRYGLHACKSNDGKLVKSSRKMKEKKITRHCPNCYMVIVKNGGCPNMICGTCQHRFCWNCLGDQEHSLYGGCCPGNKPGRLRTLAENKYVKGSATVALYTVAAPFVVAGAVVAVPLYVTAFAGTVAAEAAYAVYLKQKYLPLHKVINGNIWWLPLQIAYSYHNANIDPIFLPVIKHPDRIYVKTGPSGIAITLTAYDEASRAQIMSLREQQTTVLIPPAFQKVHSLSLDQVLDALAIIYQEIAYKLMDNTINLYEGNQRFTRSATDNLSKKVVKKMNPFILYRLPDFLSTLSPDPFYWEESLNHDFRMLIRGEIRSKNKNCASRLL